MTGRIQKSIKTVCRIDWYSVEAKISPQMPYIRLGLYSLMIRVNMAHGLHFYRRAGSNNTIAKIQPIWEKNNKKQHLTAQNALHPREQPQLLLHVRRGELQEKWLLRWKWLCVCVFVHVRVCFCASVCGLEGGGWMERHSVKRSFRNTLPPWRWREPLIDMHFSTETRAINLSATH